MNTHFKRLLAAGVLTAATFGAAHATVYTSGTFSFAVKNANVGSFNADASTFTTFPAGASATFSYTGPLNFDNPAAQNSSNTQNTNQQFWATAPGVAGPNFGISGYTGSGTVGSPGNANFGTLAGFLGSSMSANGFGYGEIMKIDLGILAAGTQITVTHDDGASLYVGNFAVDTSQSAPSSVTSFTDTLGIGGDTVVYYAEENGSPSVLQVSVPEPVSLALLGFGLAGLGLVRRRKNRAA